MFYGSRNDATPFRVVNHSHNDSRSVVRGKFIVRRAHLNGEFLTDDELVRLFRDGNEWAATAIYQRHVPRVHAIARTRCGTNFASRFDPDDVVQTAFRDLFEYLQNDARLILPGGDVRAFLSILAVNHTRTLVEHHSAAKRSVRRTCSSDDRDRPLSFVDRRSDSDQEVAELWEQIDSLPNEDRGVLQLRLQGYEVAEIAQRTGRSRRTIERILHNFRERLLEVSQS